MNASDILNRVREAYAAAGLYRDRGTVVLSTKDDRDRVSATFRTIFLRSQGLRFEFRITEGQGAVSHQFTLRTDQRNVLDIFGFNGKGNSIDANIVCMTGITFGVAHTIPRMLLPNEISGRMLCDAVGPKLQDSEHVDGDLCFAVRTIERELAFIRAHDFVLRRIVYHTDKPPAKAVRRAAARGIDITGVVPLTQTTTYEPEIQPSEPLVANLEW